MNLLTQRIEAFSDLAEELENYFLYKEKAPLYKKIELILEEAERKNAWFDRENCLMTLHHWAGLLKKENLSQWLSSYSIENIPQKRIALILAGNIPLVGFHDLLCTLLIGHTAIVKLSSNDKVLLPFLISELKNLTPIFEDKIIFTEEKLTDFDAVIATGSNNTARYFEYYFGKKPHIIRKNRNSVAILTGEETKEELELLGKDIFTYFGLGCRNVSKIFIPENYDFTNFFEAIYSFHSVMNHQKYINNYDYNKAVYLMNLEQLLENGFLLLKEDKHYASPIATLFYEKHTNISSLQERLTEDKELIQCIVSNGSFPNSITFGQAQIPSLRDYADGIDTIAFLNNIN
nr:acyl-CoA reductase [uncultured Capnocytophaga sp.]